MPSAKPVIERAPVILFAYVRPGHLARALACLRENNVPLIYAFADGAKGAADVAAVAATKSPCAEKTGASGCIGSGSSVMHSGYLARHPVFPVAIK